mgnify:FL=1
MVSTPQTASQAAVDCARDEAGPLQASSPNGTGSDVPQRWPVSVLLGVLVLLVCFMSWGVWGTSVPVGDEGVHIEMAARHLAEGRLSVNPYYLAYMLVFRFLTPDPLTAHTICRFLTSLFSVMCMALFLRSFRCLKSDWSILFVCAFWACCRLTIPYVQFGNVNVFALNIIFPSLILVVRKNSVPRSLFFLTACLWASQCRLEYWAPFALYTLYLACLLVAHWRNRFSGSEKWSTISAWTMLAVLIASFSTVIGGRDRSVDFDRYLLLGLNQCYTSLYSKFHPELRISTMVEYSELTDEVFGHPEGFSDSLKHNPKEVVKYLVLNGAINSVILVPGLLRHRSLFIPAVYGKRGEIAQISCFLLLFCLGAFVRLRTLPKGWLDRSRRPETVFGPTPMVLLCLGAAASVSLLLHIPDPRYWMSCIPVLFLWIAWSMDGLFSWLTCRRAEAVVSILSALWFMHPIFPGKPSNQELMRRMRALDPVGGPAVIAGLHPLAYGTYPFTTDYEAVTVKELSVAQLEAGRYDFVVVDSYLRGSSFWAREATTMDRFERDPAAFDYQEVGRTLDKYATTVYVHRRNTVRRQD